MLDTSLGVHAGLAGFRRRGLCRRTSRTCRILGGASAQTLGLAPGEASARTLGLVPGGGSAPRAAFPSGCLAAQTKRWAEGIRVPAPLACSRWI